MTGPRRYHNLLKLQNPEVGAESGPRGNRFLRPPRRSWRGQELVEFALVIPVLVLFLFGVLDVARIFHALIAVSNAAREGARYGMAYAVTRSVAGTYSINESIIDAAAVKEASNFSLKLTAGQVFPTCQTDSDPQAETCAPGVRLRVAVIYNYRPILFVVFPSTGFDLMREVEMVIP
jgi:Flp pilus assembly protein TadG